MWCVILTASIAFAAHSASALRCKCGSHRVEAQNSTTFAPMPVTVIPLAECKGSPFCYTAGRGGACYFRMEGEPRDYSYTVVFGCLSYQQNRQLCPWEGRKKKHDCCHYDDCNELNELGLRFTRNRCWCKNARCNKTITCESSSQQQRGHACFTQVKLKNRTDGSATIKIRRGCTTDCQTYSNSQSVQQCCNSTLCNAGQLNISLSNHTILSVERLPANFGITHEPYNWSDADLKKIFDIETLPPSTPAPTTGGETFSLPTLASATASPPSQSQTRSNTTQTDNSLALSTHPFTLLICSFVLITLYLFQNLV